MDLCQENTAISQEVFGFIENVGEIKEESITDYLMWKWRQADKKFNYVNISAFTKEQENKITGADFELELWILQKGRAVPLLIQAKKIISDHDGYCGKLNYQAHNGRQIDLLIAYARTRGLLPFYLFYSLADTQTRIICGGGRIDALREKAALYLASAYEVKDIADNCFRRKVSKNRVLSVSNAFCCLFCCPMGRNIVEYITHYFPSVAREHERALAYNSNTMPGYVELLSRRDVESQQELLGLVQEYRLYSTRNVGVFDLRDSET